MCGEKKNALLILGVRGQNVPVPIGYNQDLQNSLSESTTCPTLERLFVRSSILAKAAGDRKLQLAMCKNALTFLFC